MATQRRADVFGPLGAIAFLVAVCLSWTKPGFVEAQIDLFPNVDPFNVLRKTFDAWSFSASPFGPIGFPTHSIFYAYTGVLRAIFGDGIAEGLTFATFVCAAWLGAYVAMRTLRFAPLAAWVGAWVYVIGPFSQLLVLFTTGSALAGAYPWLVALLGAGVDFTRRRRAGAAVTAIAFVCFPMIASTPQLLFAMTLGIVPWLIYFAYEARSDLRSYALFVAGEALACLVVSLWWLVPVVATIVSASYTRSSEPASAAWTFARASLPNVFRFLNAWTWDYPEYFPYARLYDTNVVTYVASFFGVLALTFALAIAPRSRRGLLGVAAACAVFGFVVAKGLHAPFVDFNAALYKLPGFFLLIEPVGMQVVALFALAIATAVVVEAAVAKSKRISLAAAAACVALSGIAALPYFQGAMFHGATPLLPSVYVQIPQQWRALAARVNSSRSPGSVLCLPVDPFYEASYRWGYTGVDTIPMTLLHRPVLVAGASSTYFTDPRLGSISARIQQLAAAGSPLLGVALRQLGIRFVVFRGDVERGPAQSLTERELDTALGTNAVERFGDLSVYDVGDVRSPYAVSSGYIEHRSSATTPGRFVLLAATSGDTPRLSGDAERPFPAQSVETAGIADDDRDVDVAPTRAPIPKGRALSRELNAVPYLTLSASTVEGSERVVLTLVNPSTTRHRFGASVRVPPRRAGDVVDFTVAGKRVALLPQSDGALASEPFDVPSGTVTVEFSRRASALDAFDFANPLSAARFAFFAVDPNERQSEATSSTMTINGRTSIATPRTELNVAATLDPQIDVVGLPISEQQSVQGIVVDAVVRGALKECFTPYLGYNLDLWSGLKTCETAHSPHAYLQPSDVTFSSLSVLADAASARNVGTILRSLDLSMLAPQRPISARSDPVERVRNVKPAIVLGNQSFALLDVSQNDRVLVTSQLYSPIWNAVSLGRWPATLHHEQADGWRNAWLLSGNPERIIVFNALSVAEWLLFGVAVLFVAARVSRGFR